jgi:hypothetical protein
MTNRPDNRTRLLAETLEGEWTAGPAATMARRAAAHARRRRTIRRASVVLTSGALIATLLMVSRRAPAPVAPLPARVAMAPAVAPLGYEIISDEELLATLRDRPLLVLPQENGAKKIVVLDR